MPSFGCLIILLSIINYTVDPYGFFRKDLTKQLVVPNQNFLKMRYLTRKPHTFNSFVFGSSRVGQIHVQNIHNSGHWYNMTYAAGIPQDHLINIEYMIKQKMNIKELMIGLDEFSYLIDPKEHAQAWSTRHYSPILGQSEVLFYIQYLLRFPDIKVMQTAYREYQKKMHPQRNEQGAFFDDYDLYGTGQGTVKELDEEIDRNPVKHNLDPRFFKPYKTHSDEPDFSEDSLASLKRIVELSRANGIKLTIFINPIHKTTYMATNREHLFSFKRRLSKICNYYDFSGLNSVTLNNYYYYETSHYRPIVGNMIIQRIFDRNTSYNGFGELVTADTVERHIAKQRDEIRQHESNARQPNPPR